MKKPHYIKEWRKHRGLSQEQLASRIDKDQSYISKVERFIHEYNQAMLESLAYALDCEPADLIMRDPLKVEAIWTVWDNVPETDRERVIQIMSTFAQKKAG